MTLQIGQMSTAVRGGNSADFYAYGGTAPYVYTVAPGGAGGVINSAGHYTAPKLPEHGANASEDKIIVTDALLATAAATIRVGPPLFLFCDILQRELGLAVGRVYLFDQKIFQPTDSDLYIAVAVEGSRVVGNVNSPVAAGDDLTQGQYVTTTDMLGVNIISRGSAARDRRFDVLLAIGSAYSQTQQTANGFKVGRLPMNGRFINLSEVDGAAIPYRFHIAVALSYAYEKVKSQPFFESFAGLEITTSAQDEGDDPITAAGADSQLDDIIDGGDA